MEINHLEQDCLSIVRIYRRAYMLRKTKFIENEAKQRKKITQKTKQKCKIASIVERTTKKNAIGLRSI